MTRDPFVGTVPVAADAVRVWRGFRADASPAGWPLFASFLSQTLFPTEATWRPAFGLTCYLAGIKAPDGDAAAPDEFALVFYESQQVYDAGLKTVAGSLYPLFPAAAFRASGGRSGYPQRFHRRLALNQACHVFDQPVDWYHGSVRCQVATLRPGQPVAALLAATERLLAALQAAPPAGLDGLIAMVDETAEGRACLLAWQHWQGDAPAVDSLFDALQPLVTVSFRQAQAQTMTVTGGFYDPGVQVQPPIVGDQLLRLSFLRRRLAAENHRVVGGPWSAA